jgi:hypothetical protein
MLIILCFISKKNAFQPQILGSFVLFLNTGELRSFQRFDELKIVCSAEFLQEKARWKMASDNLLIVFTIQLRVLVRYRLTGAKSKL